MINNNIKILVNDSEQEEIEELYIPIPPIPFEWWLGLVAAYIIGTFIKILYNKFAKIVVSPKYLKYYNPLRADFFTFLDIVNKYSDEYLTIKSSIRNSNIVCKNISAPNKEIECVFAYMIDFPIYKIDIILSTLYDDGYDLIKIRTIEDIYVAEYTKTPELNQLIKSLESGLVLFKNTMLELSNKSIDEFGVPINGTFRDVTNFLNRRIKQLVVDSIHWK